MCPKELQLSLGNGKVNNCPEHSVLRTQKAWEQRAMGRQERERLILLWWGPG